LDLDIAIVGGGPAGVATALFLTAAAPRLVDRIAIFEKERYPREKICAGAIGARADRLLDTIGVRVDVPSAIVRGLSVKTSVAERATRLAAPIGRVVRRADFDHAFAEIARARGVRILEGARVTDLAIDGRAARMTTSIGDVMARAVVGADGVGSFVRRKLGAPRGAWMAQVVEVDTEIAAQDRPSDVLHFDITDASLLGYGWDFPTIVGGRQLVCRGFYHLRPEPDAAFALSEPEGDTDVGARIAGKLAALGVGKGARVKRFAERGLAMHEPLSRPRALLVGEAAGIDPVLGEGIAQAIFYGAVAGPYLARCIERGDYGFASWRRALGRSRVGVDLAIRARMASFIYGRTRPLAERWVAGSRSLAIAGMKYFAGERVPGSRIVGAAIGLGQAFVEVTSSGASW
jgi:menaquinone-9 beta-reductase